MMEFLTGVALGAFLVFMYASSVVAFDISIKANNIYLMQLNFLGGTDIKTAANIAVRFSRFISDVSFSFNGVKIVADKKTTPADIINFYNDATGRSDD